MDKKIFNLPTINILITTKNTIETDLLDASMGGSEGFETEEPIQ